MDNKDLLTLELEEVIKDCNNILLLLDELDSITRKHKKVINFVLQSIEKK
jgi:hypothetical protein